MDNLAGLGCLARLEGEQGSGDTAGAEVSLPAPLCPRGMGSPSEPPHRIPGAPELPFPHPLPAGARINLGAL